MLTIVSTLVRHEEVGSCGSILIPFPVNFNVVLVIADFLRKNHRVPSKHVT